MRRAVVVAIFVLCGGVGTVRAQTEAGAEDPAAREAAQRHFQQGLTLMEQENWEGALLEFERSLELFPTRSALFNLGMCQKAMFRYAAAMSTLQRFLDEYRDQADAEQLRRVSEVITELQGMLAEITVTVNVPGAEIWVDGERFGVAPSLEPVRVVAGRHTIEARLDGYLTASQEIPVTSGERPTVALELIEIARVGGIRVEANVPGAEVFVDGDRVGTVPFRGVLAEGEHEIEVRASGYETQIQTVAIATGDERIVTVSLGEPGGTDPAWFWSMVGLTGAATVATVALGTVTLLEADEYAANENRTTEDQEAGQRLMLGTDICLGVAIAAAVAGTVLAFTTDWGSDEESEPEADGGDTAWAPSVGLYDGGAGLAVVGRF